MNYQYAARMNSFVFKGTSVIDAIEQYKSINGLTHVEFNYPEHFQDHELQDIKTALGDLKVNGLAIRWRKHYLDGNFTNPDETLRRRAIDLCKAGMDVCRELGGSVITLWFENDGFDYPFQSDYANAWDLLVDGLREVADYAPDLKISVEYKPYEERNFAMVDSTGMTLYLLREVDKPNVGCTLDFCHMLMKKDSPSYGLALAAKSGKLYGLHMNDGYGWQDSGIIFGTANLGLSAEFIYYLKKYKYDGVVFFDTFPIRENAKDEVQANIDSFERIAALVDRDMEQFENAVKSHDGVACNRAILGLLK